MPFTVPNAIAYQDTIASLEQAEPDAVDFQILGDRRNVVINGGTATVTSAPSAYIEVSLSACEAVINGTYNPISAGTVTIASAPTTGSRFDLICGQWGSPNYTVVQGTVSTTNPVFPSVPSNHIVLYSVFVRNGLNAGDVDLLLVDKRTFIGPSVYRSGINDPSGGVTGDLYLKLGGPSGARSSLWLNNGTSWENLGVYTVVQSSDNTANSLVLRNSSGNFSAGTITANLVGNVTGVASNVPWTGVQGKPEVGNVFIRNIDPLPTDGVNGDVWIKVTQ